MRHLMAHGKGQKSIYGAPVFKCRGGQTPISVHFYIINV